MSSSRNFYEFFGFERKLDLDESALQKRFYELSREWHPDRFSRKGPEESVRAMENTAIINNGYRTLRDPVKRAEYLLTEEGFPIGEQRSKDVPPELLEEVFELNMALEEMRGGDETARPQLEEAKQKFVGMRTEIDGQLRTLFTKYDASETESETAKQALNEIRGALNKRRYIENLIRDVDKALNPAISAAQTVEDRL
ncbi:MAG: Fe-S protein assembly co-chaperone HscB [Bryobacteraceae bacterium]